MTEALVLGGGGVAGIAWITGLLTGLAEAGNDVTAGADVIIGTSAGSAVAAQIGSGLSMARLYARQVDPELQSKEIMAELDLESFGEQMSALMADATTPAAIRQAMGKFALQTSTVSEAERRAVIETRLPSHDWPTDRTLKLIAVDAETGDPRVFDNESGVRLVDAVAASCAVPGIWPPVTIENRRYVDGGVRSAVNADYAAGASRVLIIAPLGDVEISPHATTLAQFTAQLQAAGAEVAVVVPDEASLASIGTNALDPASRRPAAKAGRVQGQKLILDWH